METSHAQPAASDQNGYEGRMTQWGNPEPSDEALKPLQNGDVAIRTAMYTPRSPFLIFTLLPELIMTLNEKLTDRKMKNEQPPTPPWDTAKLARLPGRRSGNMDTHEELLLKPTIFKFEVYIENPVDKRIEFRNWGKGIGFVNGFTLGRYLHFGPTQTLHWPAALQRKGLNEIQVLELYDIHPDTKLPIFNEPILE